MRKRENPLAHMSETIYIFTFIACALDARLSFSSCRAKLTQPLCISCLYSYMLVGECGFHCRSTLYIQLQLSLYKPKPSLSLSSRSLSQTLYISFFFFFFYFLQELLIDFLCICFFFVQNFESVTNFFVSFMILQDFYFSSRSVH